MVEIATASHRIVETLSASVRLSIRVFLWAAVGPTRTPPVVVPEPERIVRSRWRCAVARFLQARAV